VPQINRAGFDVVVGVFMAFIATMHANLIGRVQVGFKAAKPVLGLSVPRIEVQPADCHYMAFGNSGTRLPLAQSRATVQIARR
jgi:hypothetical protein